MQRTELGQLDVGRFSVSIAKYGDGKGFHIRRMSYGKGICTRWAFDCGLYRLRIEWY